MAKKFTIEDVKNFIESHCEDGIKLLSTEYVNIDTPLMLQCKCGNIFTRNYYCIKKGHYLCKKCLAKQYPSCVRNDIEKVKSIISSYGCEYISGEYKNNQSKLLIRCKCGNLFYKTFGHFTTQPRCPACGKEASRRSRIKYSIEDVQKAVASRGYKILSDEYISCEQPLLCECSKGHRFTVKMQDILYGDYGCKKCYNIKQAVGESELPRYFRSRLDRWRFDICKKYNHKCCLTNTRRDCVVHHLKSFDTILKECCEVVGVDYKSKLQDIPEDKLNELQILVDQQHTLSNGVYIQRKIHDKFHALYGHGGNTPEQFNEFVSRYYPKFNKRLIIS